MMPVHELAFLIADRAVVCDIESECVRERMGPANAWYYDTRPMLDLREQGPEGVDMARQALAYAAERRLIEPHPLHTHLVRITRMP